MGLKFAPRPTMPTPPRQPRPRRPRPEKVPTLKEWIDTRKAAAVGLETPQDYIEVGERVGAALEQRIGADVQAIQEERRTIVAERERIYDRIRISVPATPEARETGWRQMDALGRRMVELDAREQGLFREQVHGLLSELRPLGEVEARWQPGTNRQAKAAIEEVMTSLPTSWLEASRDRSPIGAKIVRRGNYNPNNQTVNLSKRHGPKPFESVAFHEMGHRFEDTVPGVLRLEAAFYRDRTQGLEAKHRLQGLGPGYGRKELTRPDDFAHKYMGKDYGGRFYELLSMGLESVYTGSYDLAADPAFRHLILGMLAAL